MNNAKSQVALEFLIFSGIAFILIIVLTAISANQIKGIFNYKEDILVKDLALKVQGELNLAAMVEDGYTREFEVPDKLDNIDYSIFIVNGTLFVQSKNSIYIARVPKLIGNVSKGINSINKLSGLIYINSIPKPSFTDFSICQNAENIGLCSGLDIIYGPGYQAACCSENLLCC